MGEKKMASFGNMFEDLLGMERSPERSKAKSTITIEELEELKAKAEKFDEMKTENETLKHELEEFRKINEQLKKDLKPVAESSKQLEELKGQAEGYLNSWKRVQADFENYKKMADREVLKVKQYATESVAKKLIRHHDDLVRAYNEAKKAENADAVAKGFEMILKNFEKLLAEEGVVPMNCTGEKFDPYKHEALMVEVRDDLPENTIVEELDKGYTFNNKVLRPAQVKISKNQVNETKSELI